MYRVFYFNILCTRAKATEDKWIKSEGNTYNKVDLFIEEQKEQTKSSMGIHCERGIVEGTWKVGNYHKYFYPGRTGSEEMIK